MKRLLLAAVALVLVPFGCSDEQDPVTPEVTTCDEKNTLGDACAGVPSTPTGDQSACATVINVSAAAELDGAVSSAADGDCIVLGAGSYGVVALPAGVSLFGESADTVEVEAIEVSSGTSGIHDVTVASGTITVRTGAEATISGTRVLESVQDGLLLEQGATVEVRSSEITGAGRYGISAFEAGSVTLDGTIIEDGDGPGIWISCMAGCDCSSPVTSSIKNTIIRNNRIVGISFVGASGTLENVTVTDTRVGNSFEAGGGISASACSDIQATELTIASNADFGMLVDDSTLDLASGTIDDNLRGLWVQAIGVSQSSGSVNVTDTVISGNEGVGFGVDGGSVNVTIEKSQITDTKMVPLPVLVNGVSARALDVGDGLSWLGTSQVVARDLTLSNNARVGILIDGPVMSGSAIENLTATNMSGTLEILQQNLPMGGEQPATSGTTPAIESDSSERLAVPTEIAIPPSI